MLEAEVARHKLHLEVDDLINDLVGLDDEKAIRTRRLLGLEG